MAMSAAASVRETAFGGEIELRFPFCQDLVDALKSAIPGRSRAWDKADRVWRVHGAHAATAIDLLLEHFPNAEVPGDRVRPGRLIAGTETPPASLPVPVVLPAPSAIVAETPPEFLTTILGCPTCSARLEQYVRVTVATGERIARTEAPPAEFAVVCSGCRGLLIVSFAPAVAPVAA
jgi:hypothetical protein